MVGNLRHPKDHATLVKAWRQVVDRMNVDDHSPVLLLAGSFQDTYESVRLLVRDLNLGENVCFLGQVKDVYGLLHSVDLSVFSSLSESCPNGVLESMASGLAVIGTDIQGVREAVGSEGYRYLSPVQDAHALAERVVELLNDEKVRKMIGDSNRWRVERDFSLNGMLERTVRAIEHHLSSPEPTDCQRQRRE
jgi:glycosyltransferase involved in cell wall biosynthesis